MGGGTVSVPASNRQAEVNVHDDHGEEDDGLRTEYSVALRVFSALSAEAVTERLGLSATLVRRGRGDVGAGENVWEFEPAYAAAEDDFSGRLRDLLDSLRGHESRLACLGPDAKAVVWAAAFSSRPETTIRIPAEAMRRFGELGIDIQLSVYATG